jgi:hypothetical protein
MTRAYDRRIVVSVYKISFAEQYSRTIAEAAFRCGRGMFGNR